MKYPNRDKNKNLVQAQFIQICIFRRILTIEDKEYETTVVTVKLHIGIQWAKISSAMVSAEHESIGFFDHMSLCCKKILFKLSAYVMLYCVAATQLALPLCIFYFT